MLSSSNIKRWIIQKFLFTLIMVSAEEVKVTEKAKVKEAKAKKIAAVKPVEKGKVGQVRTSSRKAKITTDQGLD